MKHRYPGIFIHNYLLFISLYFCHILTNVTYAEKVDFVNFTNLPQDYQLYPRNGKNEADIPIAGFMEKSGYNYVSVMVYRNDKPLKYLRAVINESLHFSTSAKIKAELADYRFVIYACKSRDSTLITDRNNVVSGDAYLLTGQSNSTGFFTEKQTCKYCRSFGKITGNLNTDPYNPADTLWSLANQENSGALVGTMGLEIQKQLIEASGIPNCLINGGFHWSSAESHSRRTYSNPTDFSNGYGRMLYRAQKAGLAKAIKGLIFRQGETEAYHEGSNWEGYFDVFRKNLYLDYPNLQKLYVFQIDIIYYNSPIGAILRDYQRKLPQIYPDLRSIASVGTTGYDGLHYSREGNIQSGREVARLMATDFYNGADTPGSKSPNVQKVFYSGAENNKLIITFDEDQEMVYPEPFKPEYSELILQMKDFFYLDDVAGAVLSGRADGNRIVLELNGRQSARELNYLPKYIEDIGPYFRYTGPYLKNKSGMRAFSFFQVPIGEGLATPMLDAQTSINHTREITLTWNEVSNATGYILERKTANGTGYKSIATLSASSYTYQDKTVPNDQMLQYRIKAIGNNTESAEYGYAEIVVDVLLSTQNEVNKPFSVYPNPANYRDGIEVHFAQPSSGTISIISQSGEIIHSKTINQQKDLKLDASVLQQAIYFIRYDSGSRRYVSKLIVR